MKPSLTPPSRSPLPPWRVGFAAFQLMAFALLTLSAASPELHETLFHGGHAHAETDVPADGASHGEDSSHDCSLCVWSQSGFAAAVSSDFVLPATIAEEAPVIYGDNPWQSPRGFSERAHAIRGPPKLNG